MTSTRAPVANRRMLLANRQVLYPAEPNMLIKVWENNTSRKVKPLFQDTERLARLRAVSAQGSTWGVGAEGRFFGERLKEWHGVSVAYHPIASVITSLLPGVLPRGLTRTSEDVHLFAKGHPEKKYSKLPKHPVYAALMQSQTVLGARRLASAFADTHKIDDKLKDELNKTIFRHVEAVAILMANDPNLTADSPEIAPRFATTRPCGHRSRRPSNGVTMRVRRRSGQRVW